MGIASHNTTAATKAALGLAKAYGIDVETAMRLIAKARVGETGSLKRMGIVLSDTMSKQERYQMEYMF